MRDVMMTGKPILLLLAQFGAISVDKMEQAYLDYTRQQQDEWWYNPNTNDSDNLHHTVGPCTKYGPCCTIPTRRMMWYGMKDIIRRGYFWPCWVT